MREVRPKVSRGRRRRAKLSSLVCDRRGATAVEFSLVALPLLFMLFAIIELGLIFVLSLNLSNATTTVAREIRVGEMVAPGATATASSGVQLDLADFKSAICSRIALVPNATCVNQLQVDVRTLSSYQSPPTNPRIGKSFSTSGFCYYSGAAGSVVEIRTYYPWAILTPFIATALANTTSLTTSSGTATGNWFTVSSTSVFKNEPDPNISNPGAGC
jgi:Flp pilus assembly protein TadG